MEIQLLPPFNQKWNKGYLVINPENRRNICLYNSNQDRTTISYARYLMSVHLGYEVPSHLEVDHINDDKTDDRIENFQLLTPEQNKLKQEYNYVMFEQSLYLVECAWCEIRFFISLRDMKMKLAKGLEHMFCSRRCAGKFHSHDKQPVVLMPSY